jgi:membrane-bound hydrogenase subunit beta
MSEQAAEPNAAETPSLQEEHGLVSTLTAKFPFLEGQTLVQRARRVWVTVPLAEFREVFAHAHESLDFSMLCTITGTDEGESIGLIYHLARDSGLVLNLTVLAPKNGPGPKTVIQYFPNAELYERETVDLLGAQIQDLPPGNRYPLPEDWPPGEYPLRKEWSPETKEQPRDGD